MRSRQRSVLVVVLVAALLGACGPDEPRPAASPEAERPYDPDGRRRPGVPTPEGPPNLVVIVIDTLRGDALGLDGDPGLMPRLAGIAQEGVAFADAASPATWTLPSMTSLLLGEHPGVHGSDDMRNPRPLADAITTWAEALRNGHGYETAAFVGGPWFGWGTNMLQGFADVRQGFALQGTRPMVGAWLERRDPERPFFLLLHTFEAHDPYGRENHPWPDVGRTPPPDSLGDPAAIEDPAEWTRHFFLDGAARRALMDAHGLAYVRGVVRYVHEGWRQAPDAGLAADLQEAYDAGVTWTDGLLGDAVDQLEAWGLLEDTLLVVTSDHGEAFGEHGILAHGRQVYDELARVPLVMRGPPPFEGGRVVRGGVGMIDVLPTFFDWAGLAPLPDLPARSAMGLVRGEDAGRAVTIEERIHAGNTATDADALRFAVRSDRWKYIVTYDVLRGTILEELYDLHADPQERHDLAVEGALPAPAPFDDAFCAAVEALRDRLWGSVRTTGARADSPYGAGVARVRAERPPPCEPAR